MSFSATNEQISVPLRTRFSCGSHRRRPSVAVSEINGSSIRPIVDLEESLIKKYPQTHNMVKKNTPC